MIQVLLHYENNFISITVLYLPVTYFTEIKRLIWARKPFKGSSREYSNIQPPSISEFEIGASKNPVLGFNNWNFEG